MSDMFMLLRNRTKQCAVHNQTTQYALSAKEEASYRREQGRAARMCAGVKCEEPRVFLFCDDPVGIFCAETPMCYGVCVSYSILLHLRDGDGTFLRVTASREQRHLVHAKGSSRVSASIKKGKEHKGKTGTCTYMYISLFAHVPYVASCCQFLRAFPCMSVLVSR